MPYAPDAAPATPTTDSRPPRLTRSKCFAQAAGWGLLGVAAFAPFSLWPLAIVCWAGLYRLLRRASSLRQGLALGFTFGCAQFLGGVSWVYVSMHDVGGMPLPLALLATLLFAATLAMFPLLAAGLFCWLHGGPRRIASATEASATENQTETRQRLPHIFSPLFFAACWTLGEWLRGVLFSGFPWLSLGYAHTPPSPLAGYAPIVGVYGLSFLSAWLAGVSAELWQHWRQRRWRWSSALNPGAFTLAVLLASGVGLAQIHWTQPAGQPLRVSLLQGNIPQSLKWQPERYVQTLLDYFQLARNNPATLIVLPETAIPSSLPDAPAEFLQDLQRIAQEQRGNLLLGVVTTGKGEDHNWYANSAVSLGVDRQQLYNKRHLVPFGETTPPGFGWFLDWINMPLPSLVRGDADQPLMQLGQQKIAVNICYEDIFAAAIAHRAKDATLMVNMSNTAWFGDSLAQPQHLQIAQMRALENGRPMLRATNTGMTAVIGPRGERQAVLAAFTRNALIATVQGMQGTTPFQRWLNWPTLGLCLLLFAVGALTRRQRSL